MPAALDPQLIAEYNASRDLSQAPFISGCFAPFVSLTFDTVGVVRACCQHSRYHPLGRVPEQSLDEIWNGEAAQQLRAAVRQYDFDRGCGFCKWQVIDRNYSGVYARHYDWLADGGEWPRVMEFMISNTCNLECVMCCGEWSHLIRARREKAPPLPKVYGEKFFQELRAYLPRLRLAKFAGGEPFLSQESFHVWQLMTELDLRTHCFVTTNGTIYNAKVEQVIERFPCDLAISMDGTTKATFESVRINADFERFLSNLERFQAYRRRRGTTINLNYCLQRKNWHEFGDFVQFADAQDVVAFVCTVVYPKEESLYDLPADELRRVVEALDRQDAAIAGRLGRNRSVWADELARLRHRLNRADDLPEVYTQARTGEETNHWDPEQRALPRSTTRDAATRVRAVEEARRELGSWAGEGNVHELLADSQNRIRRHSLPASLFGGQAALPQLNDPIDSVMYLIVQQYGELALLKEVHHAASEERWFRLGSGDGALLRAVEIPEYADNGELLQKQILFAIAFNR